MNWVSILIFTLLQLVNVILSTMRSILTVKASKTVSAIFSAVSYTFYAGIVKLMTEQDMWVVLSTTFATNIIGVYVANIILDLFKKEKLWVFTATAKTELETVMTVVKMLNCGGVKTIYNEVVKDKLYSLQIFSYSRKESEMITEILKNYDIKYFATENKA